MERKRARSAERRSDSSSGVILLLFLAIDDLFDRLWLELVEALPSVLSVMASSIFCFFFNIFLWIDNNIFCEASRKKVRISY